MVMAFIYRLFCPLIAAVLVAVVLGPRVGLAQELSAVARLQSGQSAVADTDQGLAVTLALSQPVPWRVRLLNNPPRVVFDFREVDWTGLSAVPITAKSVQAMRAGAFRPGWSRLVLELAQPMVIAQAAMQTDAGAIVTVRLVPATPAEFAVFANLPEPADWTLPRAALVAKPVARGAGPLVVLLDPGHGGIDPGAERGDVKEADLVLQFARELKEVLLRDGNFSVVMTRDADVFVPLEARISIARAAGAHVFISIHADALSEGDAVGATVYMLSSDANSAASATLAERHDRDDLLAGVDLTQQDDVVAEVLMDMARTKTVPRTERLSAALEMAIKAQGLKMHRNPQQKASFSVLKSPDIPSVLLELGFMSSDRDLARLVDAKWRAKMATALRDALKIWAREDAALAVLPLQ